MIVIIPHGRHGDEHQGIGARGVTRIAGDLVKQNQPSQQQQDQQQQDQQQDQQHQDQQQHEQQRGEAYQDVVYYNNRLESSN